jgi:uncharacterized protein (DUF1684 family)
MSKYEESILAWREEKEISFRGEESWLSLAGLFWLADGVTPAGSRPDCPVRLPEASAPEVAGEFVKRGRQVLFRAAPDVQALSGGEPVDRIVLRPDTEGPATRIRLGGVTMALIRRGERMAIRVWDRGSPRRETFPNRQWFPIDPRYRVTAAYEAYSDPRPVLAPDVSGGVQTMESPGEVAFNLLGRSLRLTAMEEDEGSLFLIFTDLTTGVTTYPGGRYLYTTAPVEGTVEVDFNRAYNPPCAFTPYATCPLPRKENHLPLAIEAGEKYTARDS